MISVRIRISTRIVHVRYPHPHIRSLPVHAILKLSLRRVDSASVNALANDIPVNLQQQTDHTKMFILILSQFCA